MQSNVPTDSSMTSSSRPPLPCWLPSASLTHPQGRCALPQRAGSADRPPQPLGQLHAAPWCKGRRCARGRGAAPTSGTAHAPGIVQLHQVSTGLHLRCVPQGEQGAGWLCGGLSDGCHAPGSCTKSSGTGSSQSCFWSILAVSKVTLRQQKLTLVC